MSTRRRRGATVVAAALVLLVVVAVVLGSRAGYVNIQTASIDRPGPDATPAQVVQAYVDAYNARDFSTLLAISPNSSGAVSRFRFMGRLSELEVGQSRYDDGWSLGALAGDDPDHGRVYVPVTMTVQHGEDTGWSNGPTIWGYLLERADRSTPWHIVDQGVG